jgi:hypothetical protein
MFLQYFMNDKGKVILRISTKHKGLFKYVLLYIWVGARAAAKSLSGAATTVANWQIFRPQNTKVAP